MAPTIASVRDPYIPARTHSSTSATRSSGSDTATHLPSGAVSAGVHCWPPKPSRWLTTWLTDPTAKSKNRRLRRDHGQTTPEGPACGLLGTAATRREARSLSPSRAASPANPTRQSERARGCWCSQPAVRTVVTSCRICCRAAARSPSAAVDSATVVRWARSAASQLPWTPSSVRSASLWCPRTWCPTAKIACR